MSKRIIALIGLTALLIGIASGMKLGGFTSNQVPRAISATAYADSSSLLGLMGLAELAEESEVKILINTTLGLRNGKRIRIDGDVTISLVAPDLETEKKRPTFTEPIAPFKRVIEEVQNLLFSLSRPNIDKLEFVCYTLSIEPYNIERRKRGGKT